MALLIKTKLPQLTAELKDAYLRIVPNIDYVNGCVEIMAFIYENQKAREAGCKPIEHITMYLDHNRVEVPVYEEKEIVDKETNEKTIEAVQVGTKVTKPSFSEVFGYEKYLKVGDNPTKLAYEYVKQYGGYTITKSEI